MNQVTLAAQDPHTKQAIEANASTPDQISRIGIDRDTVTEAFDEASLHIATSRSRARAEAQAVAQALLDKLANAYVARRGRVRRQSAHPRRHDRRTITRGRTEAQRHVPRRGGDPRPARGQHLRDAGSPPRPHTRCSRTSDRRAPTPRFGAQLVIGVVTNNRDPDDMGRVRVSYPCARSRRRERVGARAHPERRQRARDADAAGGRRGGADRLRARRHDASVRARVAVQRRRQAGRRSPPGLRRLVRAAAAITRCTSPRSRTRLREREPLTIDAQGDVGLTTSADLALNGQKLSVKGTTRSRSTRGRR